MKTLKRFEQRSYVSKDINIPFMNLDINIEFKNSERMSGSYFYLGKKSFNYDSEDMSGILGKKLYPIIGLDWDNPKTYTKYLSTRKVIEEQYAKELEKLSQDFDKKVENLTKKYFGNIIKY